MANVTLDSNGNVTGLYIMPQTFSVVIADDDPRVATYLTPVPPVPSCALWQLQAVMTAAQWTAVTAAVAALGNAAVSAFFAHGTNVIPANSTTLAALGTAIGLTAAQVTALVAAAAEVAIP